MIAFGVALAVVGSFCFTAGAELQHGAVRAVAPRGLRLRSASWLACDRRWLLGLLALACGAGLHTGALAMAPLAVVQPIGILALVGSTLLAVRKQRRRIRAGELLALGLSVAGVTGFVLIAIPSAGRHVVFHDTAALQAAGVLIALVVVLVSFGWARGGIARSVGFASSAAACYALVSVLARIAVVQLRSTGAGIELLAMGVGIAIAAVFGGWLIQHAYAVGSPDLVLACATVGDPMFAVTVGMTVLGEAVPAGPVTAGVQLGFAALGIAGIVVLAAHRSGGCDSTTAGSGTHPIRTLRSTTDTKTGFSMDSGAQ